MNVVIIPIYKSLPNYSELVSFNQCIKILKKHKFSIITYKELSISYYLEIFDRFGINYTIELFDNKYFKDKYGYNQLMLSKEFYSRFLKYEYMLIYQLDAYVFKDNLDYWCKKNYDYIGAPLFENGGSYENGDSLIGVGNGGFSLRKIKTFIKILSYTGPIYKPKYLLSKYQKKTIKIYLFVLIQCTGYKNRVDRLMNQHKGYNEDIIWSFAFKDTWKVIKKPGIEEALNFALDQSPSYFFKKNNYKLPFGCHAWESHEFPFWSKFISL